MVHFFQKKTKSFQFFLITFGDLLFPVLNQIFSISFQGKECFKLLLHINLENIICTFCYRKHFVSEVIWWRKFLVGKYFMRKHSVGKSFVGKHWGSVLSRYPNCYHSHCYSNKTLLL